MRKPPLGASGMIFQYFFAVGSGELSILWQEFDELAIEAGRVLPFSHCGSIVRWIDRGNIHLDAAIGRTVESVSLAQGEMTLDGSEINLDAFTNSFYRRW